MCRQKTPKIKEPDAPPPPAPVLQQAAPKSKAKPDEAVRKQGGTKRYRTKSKLSIGGADSTGSGLGISG